MAKAKKTRAKNCDPLKITGSFEDVIKVSVTPEKKDKPEKERVSHDSRCI
jgi:hypothetical protein